jgi:hypothetical protein
MLGPMTHDEPAPSCAALDAVLRFLPILSAPGFVPGTEAGGERRADGVITMPWFDYAPGMQAFVRALYENGWVYDFDWPAWSATAKRYIEEPALLRAADLATIRKLFTTHVRADRFTDGHLAEMARRGHLVALLRRLQELREGMAG